MKHPVARCTRRASIRAGARRCGLMDPPRGVHDPRARNIYPAAQSRAGRAVNGRTSSSAMVETAFTEPHLQRYVQAAPVQPLLLHVVGACHRRQFLRRNIQTLFQHRHPPVNDGAKSQARTIFQEFSEGTSIRGGCIGGCWLDRTKRLALGQLLPSRPLNTQQKGNRAHRERARSRGITI